VNIFDQYGIKEVADVTLYSIHKRKDGSGEVYYVPALYLDTLKTSTVEQTGENTWARGGHGNTKLVNWDYNKEITVTLEDALCTPASLGMCYNGILSADWQDGQLDYRSGICSCSNPVGRISRMTKAIYPRSSNDPSEHLVSRFLPQTRKEGTQLDVLNKSEVVDGTRVQGNGLVNGHSYKWRLIIESGVRSVAQVPDRFFDGAGRSYPIDWNSKVSVFNGEAPAYSNFKDAIIYKIDKGHGKNKPHPYIIFDAWMDNHSEEEADAIAESFKNYLTEYTPNLSAHSLVDSDPASEPEGYEHNVTVLEKEKDRTPISLTEATFLAIVVDDNNNYHAYVTNAAEKKIDSTKDGDINWTTAKEGVNVDQFKGLDMWIRFESINALTYFILTKYEENIVSIIPAFREEPPKNSGSGYPVLKTVGEADPVTICIYSKQDKATRKVAELQATAPEGTVYSVGEKIDNILEPDAEVNNGTTLVTDYADLKEERKYDGALWAYVNPRTMKPYDDDYWFHQGEPYYIKSLTIAPKGKKINGNKIIIKADEWPGMYMMIGETYIRNRDTGEDERMQIKIPLCKVRSDQSLTLTADGDPTTFSMTLDVATPKSGVMMELNTYEVATRMDDLGNGCFQAVDGSTQVLTE
jgi:hypothetical protein